jgi:hypothetical protein
MYTVIYAFLLELLVRGIVWERVRGLSCQCAGVPWFVGGASLVLDHDPVIGT